MIKLFKKYVFDPTWFNFSCRHFFIFGVYVKPWNLHNRQCLRWGDGIIEHSWSVGVLQWGNRHLLFLGHSYGCLTFGLFFRRFHYFYA